MKLTSYITNGGIRVTREIRNHDYQPADTTLARSLDERRGVLFSSSFEFPGRYTRWDMGFVDPPLVFTARGRRFSIEALNSRGQVLLNPVAESLADLAAARVGRDRISGEIEQSEERFPEESRSRQPSVFSVVRALIDLFGSAEDQRLGLYGAFGYDLVFQFEPMPLRLPRPEDQRDLVLYLPDEILVVDHMRQISQTHRYDFDVGIVSTRGLPRSTPPTPYELRHLPAYRPNESDHGPGEYAALVERARAAFMRGDLFEVVPGQLFADLCADPPSVVFHRLRQANPAPYGALINLGEGEFLVAASPEMYVRVEGKRIETCPISGTIARGRDPVEDAVRIRELLNSAKDESELHDVHRCRPERQVARLCAGHGAGHRPPPNRALFAADPHRRPRRRRIARGVRRAGRFSQPRLGGDRDRRSQALGDPLYRGGGAFVTPLVWRRHWPRDV